MDDKISSGIGFEELAEYFHLPINQVSKELGVCATVLKKICRRNGIPRWPHRKIKSLDRMIKALESTVPGSVDEQQRIQREIEEMKHKKLSILRNPNTGELPKYKPVKGGQKKKDQQRPKPYDRPEEEARAFVNENITHQLHTPVSSIVAPSNVEITSAVTEIMNNYRAKREREVAEDLESLKFGNTVPVITNPSIPIAKVPQSPVAMPWSIPPKLTLPALPNTSISPPQPLYNYTPMFTQPQLAVPSLLNDDWNIRIAPIAFDGFSDGRPRLPVLEPSFSSGSPFKKNDTY